MMLDDRAVAAQRRGLTASIVLDVAEILGSSIGERRAGADEPRQGPAARGVEGVPKPRLSDALREIAPGKTASLRPGRAQLLLHLAPIGQPVLRVPSRSALPLDAEDMPARRPKRRCHVPILRRSRDILGTYSGYAPLPTNRETGYLEGFPSGP